ncbi:ABC transporter ATP-binding protein [Arthrobacter jiangjiafuii]|uniref:ABC-type quaternary amine transporter n=1 Tax=Arthrobacter jiangjiafuii TaxID=2817475 RepID=A0A975QZX6_9MICC|nr:ABC transporter ATP-binding protein [Arthrobacter jiangjiafuii]MBP3044821.1 ABC transporter ATP-binding protein [Arthrobacter jiangjiafuii]QWC10355.1 ABC transporter ATP-binding protein [Arthrobacter jiangjiafuii]
MITSTSTTRSPGIEFRNVTVRGSGGVVILEDLTLSVGRGEVVALLGPSGAGKTTALRAVAGFAEPSAGQILLSGKDVTHCEPRERGIGMVVQNYALFPHMTVAENVAFGLKTRKIPRREIAVRVGEALEMVGMADKADRHPRTLSGGQQQRIAIARALAPRPEVLLFDEPLSALDAQLRQGMLAELGRLHRELPDVTMLYVTHGQNEALTLADRIAVMANSRLVEYGTAEKLYRDPEFEFTARFLGSSNVLPVTISSATEALLPGHPELLKIAPTVQAAELTAKLSLRPHRVILLAAGERAENELEMQVEEIQWRGSTHLIAGRVAGQPFAVEALELAELPHPGTTVRIGFAAADAVMLRAETRNSEGVVVALPTGSDTAADTMATGHPAGLGSLAVAS